MNAQLALDSYRRAGVISEVETASPHRLVQILMEKALENLNLAVARFAANQLIERRKSVSDAVAFIDALRQALTPTDESAVAANLEALYSYMIERLLASNISNDPAGIQHSAEMMEMIKSAWDELPDAVTAEQAQQLKEYFDVI